MGFRTQTFSREAKLAQKGLMPNVVDYSTTFLCLTILNASKRPINAPANRNMKVKDIGVELYLEIT